MVLYKEEIYKIKHLMKYNMGNDNKPILFDYFKSTAEVLLDNYKRSKIQNASTNLGINRENFIKYFLSKVLPPKLSIKSGEVWDSDGNKTGQLDIIILRDDAPALDIGTEDIFLAEGVFSVIEVKSDLTSEKLEQAANTLAKVQRLNIKSHASISSGPILERPLRIVFAYEGASWDTLLKVIESNNWQELFDLVCILNSGVLIKKGRLLSWDSKEEFSLVSGIAASLGFMYLYLVSYSTSFLGRVLNLTPYFEPFNKWSENT